MGLDTLIRNFTPRHKQVLIQVALGKTQSEIGEALGCKGGTIKNHMSDILHVLKAKNKTHALVIAMKEGHITLEEINTQGNNETLARTL